MFKNLSTEKAILKHDHVQYVDSRFKPFFPSKCGSFASNTTKKSFSTCSYKRCYSTKTSYIGKPIYLYFDKSFTFFEVFKNKVIYNLVLNLSYVILVNVKHDFGLYHTCMPSLSFVYKDLNSISTLHEDVITVFCILLNDYNIDAISVDSIFVSFRTINSAYIQDFILDKDNKYLDIRGLTHLYKDNMLFPLAEIPKGNLLPVLVDNNNNVIKVLFERNNKRLNLISLINQQTKNINLIYNYNDVLLNSNTNFYLGDRVSPQYILAIKTNDDNTVSKLAFSSNGVLLKQVKDSYMSRNTVLKSKKNSETLFVNSLLVNRSRVYNLLAISRKDTVNKNSMSHIADNRIGTIDLETYRDSTQS